MGKIDSMSKVFVQKPKVFQDIFKLVFHDVQTPIRELKPMDPQNLFVQRLPANGETKRERKRHKMKKALMLAQFSRDIVKNCVCGTDDEADYMVLGIENQAHVDEFMPARVMIYDAMTLHTQMEFLKAQQWPKTKDRFLTGVPKHTKLKPVITVVCYFGTKPWDGPRSLHELFEIKTPKIKNLVPDYPIVILDPHTLSDVQLELLDTSLREVFTCIKASRDRKTLKEIVHSSPRFQHMDPDAVNLIKAALDIDIQTHSNQEEINMCQAVEEWKQELLDEGEKSGMNKGKAEGKAEALISLMQKLKLTLEQALNTLDIPESEWTQYRTLVNQMKTVTIKT